MKRGKGSFNCEYRVFLELSVIYCNYMILFCKSEYSIPKMYFQNFYNLVL